MLRNLQIEWMKIKNYRVFQVFSILYIIGILLIIYIFYRIYIGFVGNLQSAVTNGQVTEGSDIFNLFSPKNIWRTVGFWTSVLLYLPGMVIINLFINEVNFKTHRQNIIDGWKRETFIYTKIGLIVAMSLVITFFTFIATLIMYQVTGIDFYPQGSYYLIYTFLQSFTYLMFALFLATVFRRSGIAIIVFFVYGIILEWLLMWLLHEIAPSIKLFLPLQIADALIVFPNMETAFQPMPSQAAILIGVLAYLSLYIWLTVRKYKYDDL